MPKGWQLTWWREYVCVSWNLAELSFIYPLGNYVGPIWMYRVLLLHVVLKMKKSIVIFIITSYCELRGQSLFGVFGTRSSVLLSTSVLRVAEETSLTWLQY